MSGVQDEAGHYLNLILSWETGWTRLSRNRERLGKSLLFPLTRNDSEFLYIHLAERPRPYLLERLEIFCGDLDSEIVIATTVDQVYNVEFVRQIGVLRLKILVLDEDCNEPVEPKALALILSTWRVGLASDLRKHLLNSLLTRSLSSNDRNERGRLFEQFLALLFSQVKFFEYRISNFRTLTEEIDVVLAVTNLGGDGVWRRVGGSFAFVEAKNVRGVKTGQKEISAFITKIRGKSLVRIGFVCSTSGFTSDAEIQLLRFAADESFVIALLNLDRLKKLASCIDLDEEIVRCLEEAALR